MSCYIVIEINAGTSIETAAEDAVRIAKLLNINVQFSFNDVTCYAAPDGDAALLASRQQDHQARELEGPFDMKFATSR